MLRFPLPKERVFFGKALRATAQPSLERQLAHFLCSLLLHYHWLTKACANLTRSSHVHPSTSAHPCASGGGAGEALSCNQRSSSLPLVRRNQLTLTYDMTLHCLQQLRARKGRFVRLRRDHRVQRIHYEVIVMHLAGRRRWATIDRATKAAESLYRAGISRPERRAVYRQRSRQTIRRCWNVVDDPMHEWRRVACVRVLADDRDRSWCPSARSTMQVRANRCDRQACARSALARLVAASDS